MTPIDKFDTFRLKDTSPLLALVGDPGAPGNGIAQWEVSKINGLPIDGGCGEKLGDKSAQQGVGEPGLPKFDARNEAMQSARVTQFGLALPQSV